MLVRRHRRRRRPWTFLAVLTAVFVVLAPAMPSQAEPGGSDEEPGSAKTLREQLEETSVAYYDARAKLTASQKRQVAIVKRLREAELALVRLDAQVGSIAAARYKGSQLGVLNGLILDPAGTPATLLQGAAVADYLVWKDDEQLRLYREARDESIEATRAARRRAGDPGQAARRDRQAEAHRREGARGRGRHGLVGLQGPGARGATGTPQLQRVLAEGEMLHQRPDLGRLPAPRMYHALNEARLAGFTRYVHCWRTQSWGQHPLGRACDFSVTQSGFGGTATGLNKTYGDRLAAWSRTNAEALGVLYIIWYRQIWTPAAGWHYYSGYGDPSSAHTNHVHLSML